MNLHLHAQLTAGDYGNAQILHLGKRRQFFIFLFLSVTLVATVVFITLAQGGETGMYTLLGAAACIAISGWAAYVGVPYRLKKRAKKIYEQQTSLQKPLEIELTDKLYTIRSDRGEGRNPWNEFHKWKFNEKIILVYSSDLLMSMFPRLWFTSDSDYQSLKELLQREIGKPGKPRKQT